MTIRLPNSVFIHVPRTGGVWFREVVKLLPVKSQILTGDYDSHLTPGQLPNKWKKMTKFSFIRHPLSWVRSRWSHCIEHSYHKDYVFFGVHRKFDELVVDESLEKTLIKIIKKRPGLVGNTFKEMHQGVTHLVRTEDHPKGVFNLLHNLERISLEDLHKIDVEKINSTSSNEKYRDQLILDPSVVKEFLSSESDFLAKWKSTNVT